MADEGVRLHPDQLPDIARLVIEALRGDFQALLKATAQAPAPPPMDARQADQLKAEVLRDARDIVREATSEFLPDDEIDDRLRQREENVTRRVETLKTDLLREVRDVVHDEVDKLRTEFFEIFEDMEMPLDKGEKRRATRDKLESLWAMQKGSKEFKDEIWRQLRSSAVAWIVAGLASFLAFLGFKSGGGSH